VQDEDVGYLAPEYRELLDAQQGAPSAAPGAVLSGAGRDQADPGGGGGGGGAAAAAAEDGARGGLAAVEEALRQLLRDAARLGGGGAAGGGGGLKGRLAALDALLARAGEAGAGLAEVLAFMRGGSGG
jgi:hypothetical protein